MSKPRITKPTHIIAASVIAALIGIGLIFYAAVAVHAAALSTGVGADTEPVCSSAPLQPGHSYPLYTGGSSGTAGMYVSNTGTQSESVSLAVESVLRGQDLYAAGRRVPASWVSIHYPKAFWLISTHSVSLGAGASTFVGITVNVPSNAGPGDYVSDLEASTGSSSAGQANLGAGATTYLLFTVDAKPSAALLDHSGTCWAPPGHYESWAAWSGTGNSTPPPGWWWEYEANDGSSWVYTPPPGWEFDWNNVQDPHQVYVGRHPTHQCANAADYPDAQGGDFIGGQYPDTSTTAECAAWLAAGADHKLTEEPDVPGKDPARPAPVRVRLPVHTTASRSDTGSPVVIKVILLAGAICALLRYVPRAVRWVAGR